MKTPQEWTAEVDEQTLMLAGPFIRWIAAIQTDARTDLLEQNAKMREILDKAPHWVDNDEECHKDCYRCRWESLKKEGKV